MFHFGNMKISTGLGDRPTDRQTDGVSYLKENEARTVLQCNQTQRRRGKCFDKRMAEHKATAPTQ